MSKKNYFRSILKTLEELHTEYPDHNIGRHFSMALSEYGDLWGMTDKEMLFALEKYKVELSLDNNNIAPDEFVDQIIKDGMNLGKKSEEEEEDQEEWN
jgi:hypothetical protein